MYDVIMVGARCAGSPAAMLLARKGHRVLLVDKASFPSDIMSTHFIWQTGVASLKRWGLLDKLRATNCPPIKVVSLDLGEIILRGTPPPTSDGVSEAYAPRRTVLDKLLVDAAVESGAELRERFPVEELVAEEGKVAGVRGRLSNGEVIEERARIIVGADGMHSTVARLVKAPEYNTSPPLVAAYYTYWSQMPCTEFEQYFRDGYGMGIIPTHDQLTCVVAGWSRERFPDYRSRVEATYMTCLESIPRVAERIRGARRVEPLRGMLETVSFFRRPFGPGWALVGDAGYYKHPIPAQGITDAFRDAESLAEAIHAGFSGVRPLDEALAAYQQERDHLVMPMYESTVQRSQGKPLPPEMIALFSALQRSQSAMDRFFGTDAGTVPLPEFFSPGNIKEIMAAGSRPER